MRPESSIALESVHRAIPEQSVWEWARDNVDFGRAPNYDTPKRTQYDPDFMPYWKEPAEALTDPEVSEVWVWKCKRAGGSENLLLNGIRYTIAAAPKRVLYITGDQLNAERFMETRIKRSMICANATREKYRRAEATQVDIAFEDMDLRATWPRNKMAFKQDGWGLILGDEVSLWPAYSADMMRGRADSYPFSHICGISSSDPTRKGATSSDPIYIEFEQTDQRHWYMPDPKTGNWFLFEMGSQEAGYGLKWDQGCRREDGTWDLDRVKKSAYYVTPDGTRIKNADRIKVIAKGQWMPTRPNAIHGRRGYHINAFYVPFWRCDFGEIAVAFLSAKHKQHRQTPAERKRDGDPLKTFIYEYLAEPWVEKREAVEDDALVKRARDYAKGQKMSESDKYKDIYIGKQKLILVTADPQKSNLWAVGREWIDGGDSGLIGWRSIILWEELDKFANECGATWVLVDYGYPTRAMEVFEYAMNSEGVLPTKGADRLSLAYKEYLMDPREGKTGQGKDRLITYTFHAPTFKTLLLDMIRGESAKIWSTHQHVERQYVRQVTSEELVEGEWRIKRGHGTGNHLWDCEVLQLLGATIAGMYRSELLIGGTEEGG